MKVVSVDETVARSMRAHEMPYDPDSFGVEIEVEGRDLLARNIKSTEPYWAIANDGSLRTLNEGDQAFEYKFRTPLNIKDSALALAALEERLKRPGTTLYQSPRASVHVHLNFSKETMRTLCNFIVLAYMFEEVLVSQNGKDRIGNNFCLRAKDAEGILVTITESMKKMGNLWNLNQEVRYSATNLCSLLRFHTVEFRSLEFTVDSDRILTWMNTLQQIKEYARTCRDPMQIIEKFSAMGPRRLFIEALGLDLAKRYLDIPGFETKLFEGMALVQEFAYCVVWAPPGMAAKGKPEPKTKTYGTHQWVNEFGDPVADLPLEQVRMVPPPPQEPPRGFRQADLQRGGDVAAAMRRVEERAVAAERERQRRREAEVMARAALRGRGQPIGARGNPFLGEPVPWPQPAARPAPLRPVDEF